MEKGTLVEDYSEEEIAEKDIKTLEKAVDLEYFGQVWSSGIQHRGEAASSSTIPQQPTKTADPPADMTKGKAV